MVCLRNICINTLHKDKDDDDDDDDDDNNNNNNNNQKRRRKQERPTNFRSRNITENFSKI